MTNNNEFTGKVEDNSKGRKYDGSKPLAGTFVNVFPRSILAIGAVILKGKEKYPDPNNWKKVEGAKVRYQESLMRHLIKHNMGILLDEESGLPHLVHVAWNALAILELHLMEKKDQHDSFNLFMENLLK